MADGGPSVPPAPPALQAPTVPQPPTQPPQPPIPPAQPIQQAHVPQLNWSHFKPEFGGKAEEDAEAHLLRTYYWMDTHAFQESIKVQHFCLSLVGELEWVTRSV